jgi:radical SAM-linked protein
MPMRIRAVFAKTEPMRFTSHLDLYRAWERLLRRAGVDLVFSQGFNPRPKLQLAAPLPLGITSRCEIIDFWLSDSPESLQQLTAKLVSAQPPGIEIKTIQSVEPSAPPLQKRVSAAEYRIALLDRVSQLDQKIDRLLGSAEILREKRGKPYNLRPLIKQLSMDATTPGGILMQLDAREGSTGRPEEVLRALDIPPENSHIERTNLVIEN